MFAFFLFPLLNIKSQIKTTELRGRKLFVYPYTKELSESYYLPSNVNNNPYAYTSSQHFEKCFIPFYPGKLPDGEYIMYYETPANAQSIEDIDLSKIAYSTFSIYNNKKEGFATFYTYKHLQKIKKQQIYATGYFKNDVKDSGWIGYNYDQETGKILKIHETHYINGLFHGYQCVKNNRGQFLQYGNYSNGQKNGNFYNYYNKLSIKSFYKQDSIIHCDFTRQYEEFRLEGTLKDKKLVKIKAFAEFDKDNFIIYEPAEISYLTKSIANHKPLKENIQNTLIQLLGQELNGKIYCTFSKDTAFLLHNTLYIKEINLSYDLKLSTVKKLKIYKDLKKIAKCFINDNLHFTTTTQFTHSPYSGIQLLQISLKLNDKLLSQKGFLYVNLTEALKDSNVASSLRDVERFSFYIDNKNKLTNQNILIKEVSSFNPFKFYQYKNKKRNLN